MSNRREVPGVREYDHLGASALGARVNEHAVRRPDVHKDSITVAYALGAGVVEVFGKIDTTQADTRHLDTM